MNKYTLDVALMDEGAVIGGLHDQIYRLSKLLKPVMREVVKDAPKPETPSGNLVDEIVKQTNRLDYLVYFTVDMLDRLMIDYNRDELGRVGDKVSTSDNEVIGGLETLETIEYVFTHQKHTIDSLFSVVLRLEDKLKMLLLEDDKQDQSKSSEPSEPVLCSYVEIVEYHKHILVTICSVVENIINRLLLDIKETTSDESLM